MLPPRLTVVEYCHWAGISEFHMVVDLAKTKPSPQT